MLGRELQLLERSLDQGRATHARIGQSLLLCVVQQLPGQLTVQQGLAEKGLASLDEDAKLRFLRVMKQHKYIYDEEADH
jgi:hypothetical protein